MRTKVITAVTFLVGTATLASARPPPPDPAADAMVARITKHLDADKDGRISRAEAAGRDKLAKNFDRIDADHDGFLSHDEPLVVVEKRLAKKKSESGF